MLSINPNSVLIYSQIGNIYATMSNHRLAIVAFEKAIELSRNTTNPMLDALYYSLGVSLYKLQDYIKALMFLSKSSEIVKDNFPFIAELHYYRAICLLNIGKPVESIPEFNKALQLKTDYEIAYAYRALAHMQLNMIDAAISDYKHAIFYNPNPKIEDSDTFLNLGVCLYKKGELVEAKKNFERALQLNPNNEVARKNISIISKKIGSSPWDF